MEANSSQSDKLPVSHYFEPPPVDNHKNPCTTLSTAYRRKPAAIRAESTKLRGKIHQEQLLQLLVAKISWLNFSSKIRNRVRESIRQLHFRFPFQKFFSLGDVGFALLRIVLRQRLENNFALRFGRADDFFRELDHRHFRRIANVHGQVVVAHHQPIDAFNQIGAVTKTARLRAFAEHRDRFVFQRLADERRDDAAVVESHARAVGVEDSDDARLDFVLLVIGHRQRLGETLGLVVAAARADGVDVAPIFLRLRMHERVAVNFRSGGDEEARFFFLGETERLVRAKRTDLERLNRQFEIINRAGGRGKMPDVIHRAFEKNKFGDVLLNEFEIRIAAEEIGRASCRERV